jgi:hypothetical protein
VAVGRIREVVIKRLYERYPKEAPTVT